MVDFIAFVLILIGIASWVWIGMQGLMFQQIGHITVFDGVVVLVALVLLRAVLASAIEEIT